MIEKVRTSTHSIRKLLYHISHFNRVEVTTQVGFVEGFLPFRCGDGRGICRYRLSTR